MQVIEPLEVVEKIAWLANEQYELRMMATGGTMPMRDMALFLKLMGESWDNMRKIHQAELDRQQDGVERFDGSRLAIYPEPNTMIMTEGEREAFEKVKEGISAPDRMLLREAFEKIGRLIELEAEIAEEESKPE
jgi:hypothetical protein